MSRPLRIEYPDAWCHLVNSDPFFRKATQTSAGVEEFIPGCGKDKGGCEQKVRVGNGRTAQIKKGYSKRAEEWGELPAEVSAGRQFGGDRQGFEYVPIQSLSSVAERMRGRISGHPQLRNCVEEIKTVLQMSPA